MDDETNFSLPPATLAPSVNLNSGNVLNPVSPIVVPEVQIGPVNTPAYATSMPTKVSPVTVSTPVSSAASSLFNWGVVTNNPTFIMAGLGASAAAFTPQAVSNSWGAVTPWSSLDAVTTTASRSSYWGPVVQNKLRMEFSEKLNARTGSATGALSGGPIATGVPLGGGATTLGGAGDPTYVKIQAAFAGKTLNTEAPDALARIISSQFPEVTPVKAPVYAELLIQNQKDWAAVTSESAPKSPASDAAPWQPLAETILSSAEAVGQTRLQDLKSVQGKQGDQERRNAQTYLDELENLREALSSVTTPEQYQSWAREVRGLRRASGSWASVVDMGGQVISAAPSRWGFATTIKHADGTEETQWNMQLLLAAGSLGLGLASIWMQKQQDDNNWDRQMELAKLNRQWAREDYAWQMDKQLEYNKELSETTSAPSAGPAANPSISLS